MSKTSIEWSEHVWNPVSGCTRVSEGCTNCYAATMTKRLAAMGQDKYAGLINEGKGHFNGVVKTHPDELGKPLRRRKPTVYFVNSMSDLFHPGVPFEFVARVFQVMRDAPDHTFQILTKRPERMAEFLADCGSWEGYVTHNGAPPKSYFRKGIDGDAAGIIVGDEARWPLPNAWLGTSVENQETADERVPWLLRCPAAVHFLSCEPLLGPVDLDWIHDVPPYPYTLYGRRGSEGVRMPGYINTLRALGWVIIGGESGAKARPFDITWAENLIRKCRNYDVPVYTKQLGAHPHDRNGAYFNLNDRKGGDPSEWPEELRVREMPQAAEVPA